MSGLTALQLLHRLLHAPGGRGRDSCWVRGGPRGHDDTETARDRRELYLRQRERRHLDQQLPLANIITLGVRDFAGEREFYRRLGWPHAFDSDRFTVFELRGALLALFGIDQLGADARATPEPGHGGIRSSVIITVDRPEDVDALVRHARESRCHRDEETYGRGVLRGPRRVLRRSRGQLLGGRVGRQGQPGYCGGPARRRMAAGSQPK